MLSVAIERQLGATRLNASFAVEAGVTALFGRSGAGKTSVVNCIAGLLTPARGRIAIAGEVLFDSARGIDLPSHRRRIGYVFQEDRLFPHLSVRRNLSYGRWFIRAAPQTHTFDAIVALLGIEALLERRPGTLSGGEKQRVAIGRALLAEPRLLLMDEPLASLDAQRKAEILPYLERLRDRGGIPIVYVSHAIDEVARLADTLVLMSGGSVAAAGPVGEVMARLELRPLIGRFEAGSLLTCRVTGEVTRDGLATLEHRAGVLRVPAFAAAPGSLVRLRIRARDVAVAIGPVDGISIRNRLAATVAEIADQPGPAVDVRLDLGGEALIARLTRDAVNELDLRPGRAVTALIKSVVFERRPSRSPASPGQDASGGETG